MPYDESTEALNPAASAEHLLDASADLMLDLDLRLAEAVEPELGPRLAAAAIASDHGWRAVRAALTQKGMRESSCGSNENPYSRYFGYGAQFWCADFVSWAFDSTGDRNRKVPWGYPSAVESITRWGRSSGYLSRRPTPGSIFTYDDGSHTGLVVRVEGNQFITVEGNTSGPDGRVCWVWTHARPVGGPFGFVTVPD